MQPCLPLGTSVLAIICLIAADGSVEVAGPVQMQWLCLQGWLVLPISFAALTVGPGLISGTETNMFLLLETFLGPCWVALAGYEAPPDLTFVGGIVLVLTLFVHGLLALREQRQQREVLVLTTSKDEGSTYTDTNNAPDVDVVDAVATTADVKHCTSTEV